MSVETNKAELGAGTLRGVLILIGFTAIIAQIVLMRELIVVFYGNEISLGFMLANWLLWTAAGSSLAGRLSVRVRRPRLLMAGLQLAISLAFPLTILAVRAAKGLIQSVPGEILGPGPMFLTSLVGLSFFCVLSGWLFAAGSRLCVDELRTTTAAATSSVYLLEAAGSGAGGILASLALIRYFGAFQIAAFVGLLNLLAAASLLVQGRSRRRAAVAALAVLAVVIYLWGARGLEAASLARFWRGFGLVATRNSVYGNLAVVETEGSASLFENGLVVFTAPDPAAAEEAVHYALLQHPAPRSLLLIGGGVNGSLAQAFRHPTLQSADYVELDPAILDLAREYFPKEWGAIRADPRVRVHNLDGRLFLKTTERAFDVIIVNLPDPHTAQLNRFYTLEFFREAARKLNPAGILSFRLTAAETYISPELAAFLRCIHKTLRAAFPVVAAMPGEAVHFFAAKREGMLAAGPQEMVARLRARRLQASYVREYYIPFRMMPDRMLDLEAQIRPQPATPLNRDFLPIAYYFDVALWSTRFHRGYRRLFESIAQVEFGRLALAAGVAVFALAAAARWLPAKERRVRAAAGFCVAAMGFTLIALEILLLLSFQAVYGYVYHQLAIVTAAFMVGLALGSGLALRASGRPGAGRSALRWLAGLQVLAALWPLLLCGLLASLAGVQSPAGLFLVSQLLFPALALLCGLLGGYQFPIASRVFFGSQQEGSPGTLYALDLAGACLGAVALSACLVPVFGFLRTALLLGVVNLAPAALVVSVSQAGALRE